MTRRSAPDAHPSTTPDVTDEDFSPALQVSIARIRDEVALVHSELGTDGSTWTVSARVPGGELFVIRSGDDADGLPTDSTLCDLSGAAIARTPGALHLPSTDAARHAALYAADPRVGGIVTAPDRAPATGHDLRAAVADTVAVADAAPPPTPTPPGSGTTEPPPAGP